MALEPIVQIVHYTDLHIVANSYRAGTSGCEALLRKAFKQGFEKAHRAALSDFEIFLSQTIAQDPEWQGRPTWLVDTGDGTTFGDADSLDQWVDFWSPRFVRAAGAGAKQLMLYGNHDAWPGKHPACAPSQCDQQRDSLRARWFAMTFPTTPLTVDIPYKGDARIELYALNTVDHRAIENSVAWGLAASDRFWESLPPMAGPSPTDDMGRAAQRSSDRGTGRHFRILATHYPICDAVQTGHFEVLKNRVDFANDLARRKHVPGAIANLLISGHTHVAFPDLGQMPRDIKLATHTPLHNGICQIVGGSLSQERAVQTLPPTASYAEVCRNTYPYQCTVIRIRHDSNFPTNLTIERMTAARARGGQFKFLPIAENSHSFAESMTARV